jgi:hypothetical protein
MSHIGTNTRFLILALALVALIAGCGSLDQLRADRGVLDEAIASLDAEIAKYPPDSDEAKHLTKQRDVLAKGRETADKLIASAEMGDFSFLGSLGPWGATAGALLGMAWRWKREVDQRKTLARVVASVEVADPTQDQLKVMEAVQGPDTTAVVKKIKKTLPTAGA